ncbi:hypothetical protein [Priestia aryabhattai]|uniref:hypothetical protein n=1 Tax=Priestia aryabhattai TaxID=412384 RepID=UPI003CBE1304
MERLEKIKNSTGFTAENNTLYVDVLSANDFNWMVNKIEQLEEEKETLAVQVKQPVKVLKTLRDGTPSKLDYVGQHYSLIHPTSMRSRKNSGRE